MLSPSEYLAKVCALVSPLPADTLAPADALGRVLAQPALAQLAVPPFANSAMDGFLVRASASSGERLNVVGDVPAGHPPRLPAAGEAVRIMTGAPVEPYSADLRVIPVEHTDINPGPGPLPAQVTLRQVSERRHIRRAGENLSPGDTVAPAGTLIDAGALAALISTGVTSLQAYRRPRVAVMSSGDELVAPGQALNTGQIPDSNRPMLTALLRANGVAEVSSVHVSDAGGGLAAALDEVDADLVVTSGGVSVGAFDVVRATTSAAGGMWFGEVAQKPGAPQGCGRWGDTPLLTLPGNPVAAFVSFHLYVVPALRVLAGLPALAHPLDRPRVLARLSRAPRLGERTLLVPVRLDYSAEITATPFHSAAGSHMVGSLAATEGIAVLAPGTDLDQPVDVLLIRT